MKKVATVRLPVLLYHHIGEPGTLRELTIPPAQFEHQVRWMANRGYRGIRPSDWLAWLDRGIPLPSKAVLLTFDDGYADVAEHALPLVKKYMGTATVFVVTQLVGKANWWDRTQMMTIEQIQYWAAEGIEFGAHTRTHPDLTRTCADLIPPDAGSIEEEIRGSAAELAEILGREIYCFAYTYGFHNSEVERCAADTFRLAFTMREGLNESGTPSHLLKRTFMHPKDTVLDLELRLRLGWNPIERVRRRLLIRTRLKRLLNRMRGRPSADRVSFR